MGQNGKSEDERLFGMFDSCLVFGVACNRSF